MKFFTTFATGGATAAADDAYFGGFIGNVGEPIGWFFLFIALTSEQIREITRKTGCIRNMVRPMATVKKHRFTAG